MAGEAYPGADAIVPAGDGENQALADDFDIIEDDDEGHIVAASPGAAEKLRLRAVQIETDGGTATFFVTDPPESA